MDLVNMTLEPIRGMYDSEEYFFDINEPLSVNEDAGSFLLQEYNRIGLQRINFRSDPNVLRLTALRTKLAFHKAQIAEHNRLNERQAEQKFPPLATPPAVRLAEKMIPHYEQAIAEMEEHVQLDEDKKLHEAAVNAANKPFNWESSGDDLSITELRKVCTEMGIEVDPRWNQRTLLSRIRNAQKPKE